MAKVDHKPTQNQRIIEYMELHGSITQLEAWKNCGIMRLASRISDMRSKGYNIESEMITVHNQFGEKCKVKRYRLENKA